MIRLALRKDPPGHATFFQRVACKIIQSRLVSMYSHGGIIGSDDTLYHATAANGVHSLPKNEWEPEKWDLFEISTTRHTDKLVGLLLDTQLQERFKWTKGCEYDWGGFLMFAGINAETKTKFIVLNGAILQ